MTKSLDRRSVLRMSALTGLVGTAAVTTAAPAAARAGDEPEVARQPRVAGLWEVSLVIEEQQRRELALWSLSQDGVFLHCGDNGGTGFGQWTRTGGSTFTVVFREWVLSAGGALEGQLRIREDCALTGPDSLRVTSVARFFTTDGVQLGTFHASGTGVRATD